ncbi:DNA adenine methylase [Tuberibacillus calidus]|jgi:DNA adenine methylase|uniref:DNA adenine methylase n=1 Tax=Tuberibacillus calidus TaxID=340097 RepID=UPI0003F744DE|nr:Dam family site-specific DNA-(adenine-N6)-methyltransferase [Tuberibacillus calidus]
MTFPKVVEHVKVPPIKCQGIKTKLVNFIFQNIKWDEQGKWIEPFLGSGVVLFNANPQRALVSDTNKHIIKMYQDIQSGVLTPQSVRDFLEVEGKKLEESNGEYYYEVRDRFNENGSSFDFIFLNRSCFNGMMRFNKTGGFNVPFCRKPERFRTALITKIVNQIIWVSKVMKGKDWTFVCQDWRETLKEANEIDFVYMDPPYIGRHTNYYNQWDEKEAKDLAEAAGQLPCGYALSMWYENQYRKNDHLDVWNGVIRTTSHFYHVGASERNRNAMEEALIIKEGYESDVLPQVSEQLQLI